MSNPDIILDTLFENLRNQTKPQLSWNQRPDLGNFNLNSLPKSKQVHGLAEPKWEPVRKQQSWQKAAHQTKTEHRAKEERAERAEAERRAREAEAARAEAARAKEEAHRQVREQADRQVREEAERAKEEAERARKEAERRAEIARRAEATQAEAARAKEEADRQVREQAERRARELAEDARRAKEEAAQAEEAERKRKAEAARAEADRRAREEAARRAKEEAERRAREEAARAEAERRTREEAARRAKEEAKEEAERRAREEAARAEAERRTREEAARAREEAERRTRKEAERRAHEEAERKRKAEEAERERAERERAERERAEREQGKREEAERRRQEQEAARKAEQAAREREGEEAARQEQEEAARQREHERKQQEEAELQENIAQRYKRLIMYECLYRLNQFDESTIQEMEKMEEYQKPKRLNFKSTHHCFPRLFNRINETFNNSNWINEKIDSYDKEISYEFMKYVWCAKQKEQKDDFINTFENNIYSKHRTEIISDLFNSDKVFDNYVKEKPYKNVLNVLNVLTKHNNIFRDLLQKQEERQRLEQVAQAEQAAREREGEEAARLEAAQAEADSREREQYLPVPEGFQLKLEPKVQSFRDRWQKAKILVIGASYKNTDVDRWSKFDPYYIGMSNEPASENLFPQLVKFSDRNPLTTNWRTDGTWNTVLTLCFETNKKFQTVWLDISTWKFFTDEWEYTVMNSIPSILELGGTFNIPDRECRNPRLCPSPRDQIAFKYRFDNINPSIIRDVIQDSPGIIFLSFRVNNKYLEFIKRKLAKESQQREPKKAEAGPKVSIQQPLVTNIAILSFTDPTESNSSSMAIQEYLNLDPKMVFNGAHVFELVTTNNNYKSLKLKKNCQKPDTQIKVLIINGHQKKGTMYGEKGGIEGSFMPSILAEGIYTWLGKNAPTYYFFNACQAGGDYEFCKNFVKYFKEEYNREVIAYCSKDDVCRRSNFDSGPDGNREFLEYSQSMMKFFKPSHLNINIEHKQSMKEWFDLIKLLANKDNSQPTKKKKDEEGDDVDDNFELVEVPRAVLYAHAQNAKAEHDQAGSDDGSDDGSDGEDIYGLFTGGNKYIQLEKNRLLATNRLFSYLNK
jgi:hypothetical protein